MNLGHVKHDAGDAAESVEAADAAPFDVRERQPRQLAVERYDRSPNGCVPNPENYKSWSGANSQDCGATWVVSSARVGSLRLTRAGVTLSSYYLAPAADAGSAATWTLPHTSSQNSTPYGLEFYTGQTLEADTASQQVHFSNLRIQSASAP